MTLRVYNQKRDFEETTEPEGKTKASKGKLRFVIQKHDATNLHYDLRLEMEGVLKSWAVPKGPSLDPAQKRLAMMVEDHPFDYKDFEGVIPEGNYGGGTVIVWDEGFYEPMEAEGLSRKEQEKMLLDQLHSGNLKLVFHGSKIRGSFALFHMKSRGERSWILMKKQDEYASIRDVLKQDKSVKTGKTIAKVAAEHGTTPKHPEKRAASKKQPPIRLLDKEKAKPAKTAKADKRSKAAKTSIPVNAVKSTMPSGIKPMLATLSAEAFDDDSWIFEIKWDGYRALAFVDDGEVELVSRNNKSFSGKYEPVTEALQQLQVRAVLDGEIVAVNEKGMADFQMLQNWQNSPVQLQFYVFDLLWLNGYDLKQLPLLERKNLLQQLIPQDQDVIRFSDHIEGAGKDFFRAAMKQGLEGIMAKKADSIYETGSRTRDWQKIKVNMRQEVVIAGYTQPRNSRKHFGSLLLGVYENDQLVYVGHTGSGFNQEQLEEMFRKLKPLESKTPPFHSRPKTNMPATWVKPELVCEIKFTEWTKDRIARHPIFMGLREDKEATEVKFEKATTISEQVAEKKNKKAAAPKKSATPKKAAAKKTSKAASKKAAPAKRQQMKKEPSLQLDFSEEKDQSVTIHGQELQLTNLDKYYWKKERFRKGDMINYYFRIAPYLLPYLQDRPHSLNRHPNGIDAPNFYMKDTAGKVPEWITKHIDFAESRNKHIEYLVCDSEASLIYMANMGCIEMNPWHSRSASWQQPDWCLIDLDPDTTNSFDEVIEVARMVKKIMDEIGADAAVKTSGSSGIHIYIPLGARYSYEQSKQLAELIVTVVNREMPGNTSIVRNPAKRKGLIYLDFLQNRETQTAAAPYSLRPKPGVPVSTPLHWSELKKGLTPKTWHAKNIFDRLKTEGDLFQTAMGKGIDMQKVLEKLEKII